MKRTTGDDVTAFCIWERAFSERKRVNVNAWDGVNSDVGRDDRKKGSDERRAERIMVV